MHCDLTSELLSFIKNSPTCFHAVETMRKMLLDNGFTELSEHESFSLKENGKYFVTRNRSSIIAFTVPTADYTGFQIVASHSDSPTFKIKENAEITVSENYIQLNTERYGGMLCSTWLDRPLSVAGRVIENRDGCIKTHLVKIDRDLVLIPNLAIHMNRNANDGVSYNAQVDMLPLFGGIDAKGKFLELIADECGIESSSILSTDLFLYNRMPGTVWGANKEFVSAPQLDDLECAFTSLKAFLNSENKSSICVLGVFDNEEVGSGTKQGAASTFLYDTLTRINFSLSKDAEYYNRAVASSFMLSADNAHAVHPNHPNLSDPTNKVFMNKGVVIKYNANQKYTTDAISAAVFKTLCEKASVPVQSFTNRSDMLGGSTLGNISNSKVSLNTVDIGLAQLAMHSSYETAGTEDIKYMTDAIQSFYSHTLKTTADGSIEISK